LNTNDLEPEGAQDAKSGAQPPAKAKSEETAADRRGFLHRLASFGLGEEPDHLLVPRTRLQTAEPGEAGD
jgi:hypothetical protein